jgi:uncharacterized small protein (TIGR04563 family)
MSKDNRKQSLYFPKEMLREMNDACERLDRSMSWVVQTAWRIAKREIDKLPSQRIIP